MLAEASVACPDPMGTGPLGDAKFSSGEKILLGHNPSLPYFAFNAL